MRLQIKCFPYNWKSDPTLLWGNVVEQVHLSTFILRSYFSGCFDDSGKKTTSDWTHTQMNIDVLLILCGWLCWNSLLKQKYGLDLKLCKPDPSCSWLTYIFAIFDNRIIIIITFIFIHVHISKVPDVTMVLWIFPDSVLNTEYLLSRTHAGRSAKSRVTSDDPGPVYVLVSSTRSFLQNLLAGSRHSEWVSTLAVIQDSLNRSYICNFRSI